MKELLLTAPIYFIHHSFRNIMKFLVIMLQRHIAEGW